MRPRLVKIVRDRIGRHSPDHTVTYEPVSREQHVHGLRAKLVEEAVEYLLDPSVAELADVLAVVRALAIVDLGAGWEAVTIAELDKYGDRGGFEAGVGMFVNTTAEAHG